MKYYIYKSDDGTLKAWYSGDEEGRGGIWWGYDSLKWTPTLGEE